MADPLPGPYGNLGDATYDEDTHEWRFTRDLEVRTALVAIDIEGDDADSGDHVHVVKPSPNTSIVKQRAAVARWTNRGMDETMLLPLLRLSEAIGRHAGTSESRTGLRLCAGRLWDTARRTFSKVVAWTSGDNGSDISITRLIEQKQSWDAAKHEPLKVPVPDLHSTKWVGPGFPIQQICISQSVEDRTRAHYLAARLPDRILIFHLGLRDSVVSMRPCHVGSDSAAAYADVAFNWWYSHQYLVSDVNGMLELWQIEDRTSRLLSTVQSPAATLSENDHGLRSEKTDGWCKSLWISGPSTIAVCHRTFVTLYNATSEFTRLCEVNIPEAGSKCWVLDAIVLPEMPKVLFVLTELYILAYEMNEGIQAPSVRALLAQRHYMVKQDLSLRLLVHIDLEDLVLFVHTPSADTAACFRAKGFGSDEDQVFDPSLLRFDTTTRRSRTNGAILCSTRQSPSIREDVPAAPHAREHRITAEALQMISVTDDYRLHQTLLFPTGHASGGMSLRPPDRRELMRYRGTTTVIDEMIDDEEETVFQQRPTSAFVQGLQQGSDGRVPLRVIDLSRVTTALNSISFAGTSKDLSTVVHQIQQSIKSPHAMQQRTLLEIAGEDFNISDVDQADVQLSEIITSINEHSDVDDVLTRVVVQGLPALRLGDAAPSGTLASMYDSIIADWITPLAPAVSGRIRLVKERLARQMAADVTLSCHIVRQEHIHDADVEEQTAEEVPNQFTLPVRGPPTRAAKEWSAHVASLPTPSATPSVVTGTSQSSYAPHKWCLPNVTDFSEPLPVSLPRSTQRVLQHWDIGADPDQYDWQRHSKRITRQTEAEQDSQMTEKERAKLKRRAERHLKRERREAMASQQQQMMSSQAPEIVQTTGSQPAPALSLTQVEGAADQSSQSQPVIASQAMPGRYGSRTSRPMKKKRKQGF